MKQMQNLWIIRWDKAVKWPDGLETSTRIKYGTYEDAERYANELSEEYGLKAVEIT